MTLWEAAGTVAASFGVCFSLSLLPLAGGVEAYLVATSALLPRVFVTPLVLATAAGSVGAKTVIFLGANRVVSLPWLKKRREDKADSRIVSRIQEGPWIRRGLILLAAGVGLPPFYGVALAAGALKTPLVEFLLVSFVGQSARFGFVWALPHIVAAMAA